MFRKFVQNLVNLNDEKTIVRNGTFWNLISSIFNSAMTAIILFFISLTGNVEMNGWFSIATAVAYQCQTIGFFGVRNFHISDINQEYSFSDYFYFNLLSSILMIIVLGYMSFGQNYTSEKAYLIYAYGIYRGLDIFEALFHDEYQRNGRLDIGVILQTIRLFFSLFSLILVLIITKSLLVATVVSTILSGIFVFIQNQPFLYYFPCKLKRLEKIRIKRIFQICLPIFIAGFINMYLANASKYAIDNFLNDSFQGTYAILVVPVFTINLLSTVIYRPYITKIANSWYKRSYLLFKKLVYRQICVIFVLTVLITLFGYIIGLTLLSLLYSINLGAYMPVFIVLLIGGGINTLGAFLNNVVIIIREQNKNMFIYIASAVFTMIFSKILVEKLFLMGAAILYVVSSLIIVLCSFFIIYRKYFAARRCDL